MRVVEGELARLGLEVYLQNYTARRPAVLGRQVRNTTIDGPSAKTIKSTYGSVRVKFIKTDTVMLEKGARIILCDLNKNCLFAYRVRF